MNDYYPPGVSSLPDDEQFIDYDYEGKELYRGDEVYDTSSGFVLAEYEEVIRFMSEKYGNSIEME